MNIRRDLFKNIVIQMLDYIQQGDHVELLPLQAVDIENAMILSILSDFFRNIVDKFITYVLAPFLTVTIEEMGQ